MHSEEKKKEFRGGGDDCGTVKEKGFYVGEKEKHHVSQEKPRIPVGHSSLRRLLFKEKSNLRAPQGKKAGIWAILSFTHIIVFLPCQRSDFLL